LNTVSDNLKFEEENIEYEPRKELLYEDSSKYIKSNKKYIISHQDTNARINNLNNSCSVDSPTDVIKKEIEFASFIKEDGLLRKGPINNFILKNLNQNQVDQNDEKRCLSKYNFSERKIKENLSNIHNRSFRAKEIDINSSKFFHDNTEVSMITKRNSLNSATTKTNGINFFNEFIVMQKNILLNFNNNKNNNQIQDKFVFYDNFSSNFQLSEARSITTSKFDPESPGNFKNNIYYNFMNYIPLVYLPEEQNKFEIQSKRDSLFDIESLFTNNPLNFDQYVEFEEGNYEDED